MRSCIKVTIEINNIVKKPNCKDATSWKQHTFAKQMEKILELLRTNPAMMAFAFSFSGGTVSLVIHFSLSKFLFQPSNGVIDPDMGRVSYERNGVSGH